MKVHDSEHFVVQNSRFTKAKCYSLIGGFYMGNVVKVEMYNSTFSDIKADVYAGVN